MKVTPEQEAFLLRGIHPARVKQSRGSGNKSHSHVEGWEIRAHLDRVFGFGGWSLRTNVQIDYAEQRENKDGYKQWYVGAMGWAQLTIHDHPSPFSPPDKQRQLVDAVYEDVAFDESINTSRGEATDQAVKAAATGALKRAAVNLGDQFGLSLYNAGGLAPIVWGSPWNVDLPGLDRTPPGPIEEKDGPVAQSGPSEDTARDDQREAEARQELAEASQDAGSGAFQ